MSSLGREVIRAIDERQRAHEEKLERDYWRKYADRLNPKERKRLCAGDYKAIARPVKPDWQGGTWLEVTQGLSVRIKTVTFRGRFHLSIIDQVRDFRTNRLHMRHFREDPGNMLTIVPVNDRPPNPPEPERLSKDEEDEIGEYRTSRHARARYDAERADEVSDLMMSMRELRSSIDAMPPERKRRMSKTLWTLRARLDSAERELLRRMAA